MTDRKLSSLFGILSIAILTALIFKLDEVSNGMNISGLFLGGIILLGIILGCIILTGILRIFFKKTSFLTILFMATTISFAAFLFYLYSGQ